MAAKTSNSFLYLIVIVGLVGAAILTSAIINATRNNQSTPTDIRARAGVANSLKLTGTVASVDELQGIIIVENVQFADSSRSGAPKNLGTWTVTPPPQFSLGSAFPGAGIEFTVDAKTFDISSKSVSATSVTVLR